MPKRHGNLFPSIIEMDNLRLAHKRARRGKSQRENVRRFEADVEGNLERIQVSLRERTFTTSPYQTKVISEPKKRLIYILPFSPDRIVQHALVGVVGPIWEALFIEDSYSCRPGKGIHAGSRKAMEFVRRFKYCLKADVSKYYQSVNHDVIYGLVERKIKCPDTLWLLRDIIYSATGDTNIPIGNYTSQWLGNLYLNELDQLLKHKHKIVGYVRYCDDFCLFHDDKRFLHDMARKIEGFLSERLKLTLSKCDVFPVKRGVDFLGYRHFPNYILLRKSTAKQMRRRLRKLPEQLESGTISGDRFRSIVASYQGWLKWANTHNLATAAMLDELVVLANAA